MPPSPIDIPVTLTSILQGIASLKGSSRIERLAALAGILVVLAEAAKATEDENIKGAVNEVADAVKARAAKIKAEIDRDADSERD